LPLQRVALAHERGKVVVDEHPAASGFAGREDAAFGAHADLFGVHLQKVRRFFESQRVHGRRARGFDPGPRIGAHTACAVAGIRSKFSDRLMYLSTGAGVTPAALQDRSVQEGVSPRRGAGLSCCASSRCQRPSVSTLRASIPRAIRRGRRGRRSSRRRPFPWPGIAGADVLRAWRERRARLTNWPAARRSALRFTALRFASFAAHVPHRHPGPPPCPMPGRLNSPVSEVRLDRRASRCAWCHVGRGAAGPRVRGRAPALQPSRQASCHAGRCRAGPRQCGVAQRRAVCDPPRSTRQARHWS
jgi:hypothetical protein